MENIHFGNIENTGKAPKNNRINFDTLITCNDKLLTLIDNAKKIASSDMTILITGENGSGKNVLAQAIHDYSNRKDQAFISVNCIAIPESLFESELFGHEKGAFTDEKNQRHSKFELANNGTIYLDEIGDMCLLSQGRLLKAIEDKQFQRIGGERNVDVDVRIIASTNQDLQQLVKEGRFREDLYYRLSEIGFHMPSLKDRREDIALLIQYFIGEFNTQFHKTVECVSNVALTYLLNYDWPGNIRELKNIIKTSIALSDKNVLWLEDIPLKISLTNENMLEGTNTSLFSLKHAEKEHIIRVLNMCRWNKSKAARLLEISRPRLDRKITEFKLRKNI